MRISKKMIGVLVLVVLIPLLYLGLKKPEVSTTKLTPTQQKVVTALERDSDGDGLKDWEEILWKTSPTNTDSDNDTTSDGEEVAGGRDPLKAGPNDFISIGTSTENGTHPTSGKAKTTTEAFARDFFGKYIALVKTDGKSVSEDDQIAIIDELLSKKYITLEPTVYPESAIKTSTDNSKTALRKYGNAIGAIFIKNSPKVVENELTIFETALDLKNAGENGDMEIQKLDEIIASYQKNVRDINSLVAPSGTKELQLALLNSLSGVLTAIESLRASYDDPILGLPTLSLYQTEVVHLGESMLQLYGYFTRNNITFTQEEGGYIFSSII